LFGCFFEWGKGKERKELTARERELEGMKNKRERERLRPVWLVLYQVKY
jgi:hypothetical protein